MLVLKHFLSPHVTSVPFFTSFCISCTARMMSQQHSFGDVMTQDIPEADLVGRNPVIN